MYYVCIQCFFLYFFSFAQGRKRMILKFVKIPHLEGIYDFRDRLHFFQYFLILTFYMISSSFLIQTKTMVYCSQVVDFQQNVSVKNISSLDQILNQVKLKMNITS